VLAIDGSWNEYRTASDTVPTIAGCVTALLYITFIIVI